MHACLPQLPARNINLSLNSTILAKFCLFPVFFPNARQQRARGRNHIRCPTTTRRYWIPSPAPGPGSDNSPRFPRREVRPQTRKPPDAPRITAPSTGDPDLWTQELVNACAQTPNTEQEDGQSAITAWECYSYLELARHRWKLDVLAHLALQHKNWDVFHAVVKKLLYDPDLLRPPTTMSGLETTMAPWSQSLLDSVSKLAIGDESVDVLDNHLQRPEVRTETLDEFTVNLDPTELVLNTRKRMLGILWLSIGRIIAAGAAQSREPIMPHILRVLADFHHLDIVPEQVYMYDAKLRSSQVRQPPLLYLLSSRMMVALSDASWKNHPTNIHTAVDRAHAQHIFGYEIPGTRIKRHVPALGPEVWLELVLWSCLHGGWIEEGATLITEIARGKNDTAWSLICWRDILREVEGSSSEHQDLSLDTIREHLGRARSGGDIAGDKSEVERTISREVVVMFVDAVVDNVMTVVGTARGIGKTRAVQILHRLRKFLEATDVGLSQAAWNSVVVRLLELGRVDILMDTRLAVQVSGLSSLFGQELLTATEIASTPSQGTALSSYALAPSGAPLNILHRALESFVRAGDATGAFRIVRMLQDYTDENKKRSIVSFFRALIESKTATEDQYSVGARVRPNPVIYPGFFPSMTPELLAKLLQLMTRSRRLDVGAWLLRSEDVDGPLIDIRLFEDEAVAIATARFAAETADRNLLSQVMEVQSAKAAREEKSIPRGVLQAALNSQVVLGRWASVEELLKRLKATGGPLGSDLIVALCSQLLRLDGENPRRLLHRVLRGHFGQIGKDVLHASNVALAMLAQMRPSLRALCAKLCTEQGVVHTNEVPTEILNGFLEGLVPTTEVGDIPNFLDSWCQKPWMEPPATLGTPRMPKYRVTAVPRTEGIVLNMHLFPISAFTSKFRPDAETFRIVMRGIAGRYRRSDELDTSYSEVLELCRESLRELGFSAARIKDEVNLAMLPG